MKEVKITIEDEDSKVLISMKPEDEDKMTTTIEFEPEIDAKELPTDVQYIGIKFLNFWEREFEMEVLRQTITLKSGVLNER